MIIYKADNNSIVFGIDGGVFEQFNSEPRALILKSKPVQTKLWLMPSETVEDRFKKEVWEYGYEIREFSCDEKLVYIFRVSYLRISPGKISGRSEFFVEKDYALNKVELLRSKGHIAEYHWDKVDHNWIEIEHLFKDED